jgi:hypothetical protein
MKKMIATDTKTQRVSKVKRNRVKKSIEVEGKND